MSKEKYIPILLQLFREYGYDGASLSKISQATGLGKASLYHHFPGGKEEMMDSVLDFLAQALENGVIKTLKGKGDCLSRFKKMCQVLNDLYEEGKQPCVFAILLSGSARDTFHQRVSRLWILWLNEMMNVLIEAGFTEKQAKERSEAVVIAIQGSLILAQGLRDPAPFKRMIEQLPAQICQSHPPITI